ncbi:TNF receptor-associated factor 6-like [Rhipicephalus microplus]|uniref:TNF receptor-associated factor 6-like n=1 Tax=Rhipicephalus microplus TaxID=6941 RepID=UPI003F6ACC44
MREGGVPPAFPGKPVGAVAAYRYSCPDSDRSWPCLDSRPRAFVDTVPSVFCCTLCGVIPAFSKGLTPCCHVFCQPCFDSLVQREHRCPLDQTSLAYDAVETRDSVRGGIYQLRALCPNSSSGCSVVAFLLELKEHFASLCDFIQVQFPCCGTAVLQKAALSHYLDDCAGTQR